MNSALNNVLVASHVAMRVSSDKGERSQIRAKQQLMVSLGCYSATEVRFAPLQ